MVAKSGTTPFSFIYRPDLHTLPSQALDYEVNLHGGFAEDKREGFGELYYGMPEVGILRIDADMQSQTLIQLPDKLKPLNFHSTKLGMIEGNWRLILPANDDEMVAVITLDGDLDFILTRPEFDAYQAEDFPYKPTDTALVDEELYIADGYGANYISRANVVSKEWTGIFGGKTEDAHVHGKFGTAHGINLDHHHHHLVIADRLNSRIQVHDRDGEFVQSHGIPTGAWCCGIDFVEWSGQSLAVVGCLYDTDSEKKRPAPIYILDADSYQVISTLRPKEDLGIDLAQRLHNVVWHIYEDTLYLICQSWNPGYFFVLECIG